ncbi:MAG TPA: OB-fold nucleic acid binding domain-containing protein, partial [Ferruginibacter sp.]|nr:OB-fold nucleic acid binding domain-containing protein [Ferruginibacter sp.]
MFNKRTRVKDLLAGDKANYEATVMGWVRTFRNNQFIALNDGSTNNNIQVVAELGMFNDDLLKRITTGACIKATGDVIPSLGKGQKVELKARTIEILGDSDAEKFPLQPKKHSLEFLREIAHLRFRTNTFGAVFRVRHALAFAIHKFFNEKGFVYMHTPIITASDAEGAGEMFRVTTLPIDGTAPRNDDGSINFKEDFFGRSTNLTVSGQLEGELAAMAFSDVYTFGPTFRA